MGKSIKEKLRQIIAAAVAAAAVTAVAAVPSLAAEQVAADNIPPEGYKFVDIANNGEGTLVAMAKGYAEVSGDYSYVQLFYSLDNGATWNKNTSSLPDVYVNPVTSNRQSQQQLLWWDAQDTFVVHTTKGTFISADGQNWERADVSWSSASMIAVQGDYLLHAANQKARAAAGTGAMSDSGNPVYTIINNAKYYAKALAAKPAQDGKMEVLIAGPQFLHSYDLDTATLQWKENATPMNNGTLPSNATDMIYAAGADRFLFVDGSGSLKTAAPSDGEINYVQYVVKDGVNVTGVNANDKYIAVGMSDGTMYYTPNTAINADTVWTQVPDMSSDEPIKNIEFIDENSFVALSDTKIYNGSLISEPEKQEPEITQPSFGAAETSNDGFWAKTATFTLTPNGNTNINVKVSVNDQEQIKTIENIEAEIKFGIIVIGSSEAEVNDAQVSASIE